MSLRRRDLDPDPLRQFERWREEAGGLDTVALATATAEGAPSVRMVLLKGADERGFVFHSSYEGRKARELAENPRGALLFYWQEPGRQVRVEGEVERVDQAESEAYFRTRPRGGQLAAWASTQSEVDRLTRGAGGAVRRDRSAQRRARGAAPAALGRLSSRPGVVRVLGAPRQPHARPLPLSPWRGRVGGRTAEPLTTVQG